MNLRGLTLQGRWAPEEIKHLRKILSPIPANWLEENPHVQALVRQDVLQNGPSSAPGHSQYIPGKGAIVVYDKGVYHAGSSRIDEEQFARSIYHELAHAVLRRFDWMSDWNRETKSDGFVDEYAKTNATEDFADTLSEFFIDQGKTELAAPRKAAFIRDRLAREKVAMASFEGFADEIEKIARFGGLPRGLLGRGLPRGLKLGLVGGAGAGTYAIGKGKGRRQGQAEGAHGTRQVAQRAYKMGVMRGAVAMRTHILKRMRSVMGAQRQATQK